MQDRLNCHLHQAYMSCVATDLLGRN